MLLFVAIAVSFHLLLGPPCASAFAFNLSKEEPRTKVVVHKIKDRTLSFSHLIHGGGIDINDLKLYGGCFEDGSMLYLATWENDTRVIGMVEVLPDNGDDLMPPRAFILDAQDLKDYVASDEHISSVDVELLERIQKGGESFNFQGLRFDDVVTCGRCRRKGVATALFSAIERDAYELVERMEKCGGKYFGPSDGRIRLEVASVPTKAALGFYRSIGFQFKPWQDENVNKQHTYVQRLRDRLKWTWHRFNPKSHTQHLIKIVGNATCSTK